MPSHIRTAANRLLAALNEARVYIPGHFSNEPGPLGRYMLRVGIPDGETGTLPFLAPSISERISAHQKLALAICDHAARTALGDIQRLLHAAPGAQGWAPPIAAALNGRGMFTFWIDAPAPLYPIIGDHLPEQVPTALETLLFALRNVEPPNGRTWQWGNSLPRFPAASPTCAAIVGMGLFAPQTLRATWKGEPFDGNVFEVFSPADLGAGIHARADARTPAHLKRALRKTT